MDAAYVFRARFRLDPEGVRVDPRRFETVVEYPAPDPGTGEWRFFRDHLWRGELNDPTLRDRFADRLGVPVEELTFSELRTDEEYLEALRDAIADDLDAFNAATVDEAITKYIGSSIRVESAD